VDEVLAVGDAAFQKKCLGKMGDVAKEGRTVLFVSHNLIALRSLCPTAMWLDGGEVQRAGPSHDVVADYLKLQATQMYSQTWDDLATAPGNEYVRLRSARVTTDDGTAISQAMVSTGLRLEFEYWNLAPDTEQGVSIHVKDAQGIEIFLSRSHTFSAPGGLIRCVCRIPGNLLNDATYHVRFVISRDVSFWLYSHDDLLIFQVHEVERSGGWLGKWPGFVRPELEWLVCTQ
jgi:lipopolysaccharide transport system ATP-binding protein